MIFEWYPKKALDNEAKHGVSFLQATEVFRDPKLVLAEDASHSGIESRYLAFGRVGAGVLTVRFTLRGERVRIIGAGYWRRDKAYYDQANRLQR